MLHKDERFLVQCEMSLANECAVTAVFEPNRGCPIASQVATIYYGRFGAAENSVDAARRLK